jgi:hypothetical protein
MKMMDAYKKHKLNFSIIVWVSNSFNLIYLLASSLTVVMLLLSIDISNMQVLNIAGIEFKTAYLVAIAIGYMPASILNAILKKFKPSEKK